MTDKEKIREEIERLKEWQPIASPSLNKLLSLLDSMQEEPVSEDLEKASVEAYKKIVEKGGVSFLKIFKAGAEWYASHNTKLPGNLLLAARKASIDMCDIDDKHLDEYPYHPIAEQKFIEGANWQKEQMMKDSIDTTIQHIPNGYGEFAPCIYAKVDSTYKEGDKVKVLVIKEEQI